jgi:hypothetical protein
LMERSLGRRCTADKDDQSKLGRKKKLFLNR